MEDQQTTIGIGLSMDLRNLVLTLTSLAHVAALEENINIMWQTLNQNVFPHTLSPKHGYVHQNQIT